VGRSIGGLFADVNLRYMPLGICQIIEALQSCTLAGECRFRFVADESCIQAVQVVQKLRRENSFEDRTVEAHFCRLITLAIGPLQLSHTTFGGTSFLFVPVNVMASWICAQGQNQSGERIDQCVEEYRREHGHFIRNHDVYRRANYHLATLDENHGTRARRGNARDESGHAATKRRSFCITSRPSAAVDNALGCRAQWVMPRCAIGTVSVLCAQASSVEGFGSPCGSFPYKSSLFCLLTAKFARP
jgi:hypothetical protein